MVINAATPSHQERLRGFLNDLAEHFGTDVYEVIEWLERPQTIATLRRLAAAQHN